MNEQNIQNNYIENMKSFYKYIPLNEFKSREELEAVRQNTIEEHIQKHLKENDPKKRKIIRMFTNEIISDKEFGIRGYVSFLYENKEVFVHVVAMELHRSKIKMIADGVEIEKPKNKKELFEIYSSHKEIKFEYCQ